MNYKAIVVLGWLGLSGFVIFRDWSKKQTAIQELTGIWLATMVILAISEVSDQIAVILALMLAFDVLVQPGTTNAATKTSSVLASVLAPPTSKTSTPPQGTVLA